MSLSPRQALLSLYWHPFTSSPPTVRCWRSVCFAGSVVAGNNLKATVSLKDCTAGPSLAKSSSTETILPAFSAPLATGTRQEAHGTCRTQLWLSCCGKGMGPLPIALGNGRVDRESCLYAAKTQLAETFIQPSSLD